MENIACFHYEKAAVNKCFSLFFFKLIPTLDMHSIFTLLHAVLLTQKRQHILSSWPSIPIPKPSILTPGYLSLNTSLSYFSPQVRLTASALFSPPGDIPIAGYLCVCVIGVWCKSWESLKSVRGEGGGGSRNRWTQEYQGRKHPWCWSCFTQDREGTEKFRKDKSVAWRQGCKDQKFMRRGQTCIDNNHLHPMCPLLVSSAYVLCLSSRLKTCI